MKSSIAKGTVIARRLFFGWALTVAGLSSSFSPAWAADFCVQDICVQDNFGNFWKFTGVKSLSVAGEATALEGIFSPTVFKSPVSGSVTRLGDGTVKIGVFVHVQPINNFTETLQGDLNFNASGNFENTGDVTSDGPTSWKRVSCDIVPAPAIGPAGAAASRRPPDMKEVKE